MSNPSDLPRSSATRGLATLIGLAILVSGCAGALAAAPEPSPSATPAIGPTLSAMPAAPSSASPGASLGGSPGASNSPSPAPPVPSPTAGPTTPPVGIPAGFVAGTINGVLIPFDQAARATRHPISVMVDDQAGARPQAGLSTADLVIQAPAEGGIPRYLAFYQAGDAQTIGPVRSTRRYYVGWASEWRALYAHVGGAPNALNYLRQVDRKLVYNADGFHWGPNTGYMVRIRERFAPHNVYTNSMLLFRLADHLGARTAIDQPAWTFIDDLPLDARPTGGSIVIPYLANRVTMRYDRTTNHYLRSVSGEKVQVDSGNGQPVAPRNVIVQFVRVGRLQNAAGQPNNIAKGRLEVGYIGSGKALVLRNGEAIQATWSKQSDGEPTLFRYLSGPSKGQPVPLVRGQIFIHVVPIGTKVVVQPGTAVPTP